MVVVRGSRGRGSAVSPLGFVFTLYFLFRRFHDSGTRTTSLLMRGSKEVLTFERETRRKERWAKRVASFSLSPSLPSPEAKLKGNGMYTPSVLHFLTLPHPLRALRAPAPATSDSASSDERATVDVPNEQSQGSNLLSATLCERERKRDELVVWKDCSKVRRRKLDEERKGQEGS